MSSKESNLFSVDALTKSLTLLCAQVTPAQPIQRHAWKGLKCLRDVYSFKSNEVIKFSILFEYFVDIVVRNIQQELVESFELKMLRDVVTPC
jgi:hypothetical protein